MKLLIYLVPGLLLGMALQRCGLGSATRVRRMLAWRDLRPLRCLLAAIGFGMLMTAFLSWLAVIDIDETPVLPLDGGVVIGGLIVGVSLGLTGCSVGVCLAEAGGGRMLHGLSGLLGAAVGVVVFRLLGDTPQAIDTLLPGGRLTLFRTTLDKPWLLDGSFLGVGCAGALLLVVSVVLPRRGGQPEPEEDAAPPVQEAAAPETLPADAFIATLPEEEPMVVDTAMNPPEEEAEEPPEDDEESLRELALLDGGEEPDCE